MVGKKIEKESKKGECGPWHKWKKKNVVSSCGCGGVNCVGFIGALWYYIATATGFWDGVWGVVKALFWPGFLVHDLLLYIGA